MDFGEAAGWGSERGRGGTYLCLKTKGEPMNVAKTLVVIALRQLFGFGNAQDLENRT